MDDIDNINMLTVDRQVDSYLKQISFQIVIRIFHTYAV